MFNAEEYVQYGMHGICRILGLQTRYVNKKSIEYYVLEPIEQHRTWFYVPVNNDAATAKMHPIITPDELQTILCSGNLSAEPWIPDNNQRKQRYRDIIGSGDRVALVQMLRTLFAQKETLERTGKRIPLCDEAFIKDARKLLDAEFSMVLGIPQDQIGTYIQNIMSNEQEFPL